MKKIVFSLLYVQGIVAQVPNYLEVCVGYRDDSIRDHSIDAVDADDALVLYERIDIPHFNVYEIGAKVRYEPFCGIFGRGDFTIGFVNGGKYRELDTILGTVYDTHAQLHDGQTIDWNIAGGYQLSFFGLGIAPLFGWSYNKQDLRFRHTFTNGAFDPIRNGLRYMTYWNGPFVALDFFYQIRKFLAFAGYEYHWPHWKGYYYLPVPSDPGVVFSNIRRSHHAIGNVFYLDLWWNFNCGWAAGASYKFQDFFARSGDFSPYFGDFASQGFPEIQKTDVKRAEWQSHQVTLDLLYLF